MKWRRRGIDRHAGRRAALHDDLGWVPAALCLILRGVACGNHREERNSDRGLRLADRVRGHGLWCWRMAAAVGRYADCRGGPDFRWDIREMGPPPLAGRRRDQASTG